MTGSHDRSSVGIRRIEAIHYYVKDLDRSKRFYVDVLDFAEVAHSSALLEEAGKQRSALFKAGSVCVLVSCPQGEGGRAWRWLRKHPEGVGSIVFEVEDIDATFAVLEERGATPITNPQRIEDEGGCFETFSITTPFGGATFRFVCRRGYKGTYPDFALCPDRSVSNSFGFLGIDHVTSNFETMRPALLWLEHVLGFERFWQIAFHTGDVAPDDSTGSGLRSQVMNDPASGAKFANNEPLRPFFRESQINIFHEELRGDGIQHVAIGVKDLISAVRGLRERGLRFMPTPARYYDLLPQRLAHQGVGSIDEPIETLAELGILVDGSGPGKYLLQIFVADSAQTHADAEAGPFFFEFIQRKGDPGFGGGNFRALFESIERQQHKGGSG